jgi:hypothetical protein
MITAFFTYVTVSLFAAIVVGVATAVTTTRAFS